MLLGKVRKLEWPLLIIILISISSQIIFIRPVTLSDQIIYYRTAVNFPHLPEYPNHWTMRLGLVLPVAVLYRIFGHCELVYYFLPISSTILLLVSTYLIGKKLFNRMVGFIAALWINFLPNFLLESGNLLPDITASACLTTGIMLLLFGKDALNNKWKFFHYFLSGALFGWAYLSKEYFAVFAIFIPLIFWLFKIPKKYIGILAIGILLIISIEFTIYYLRYGNPLIRLITTEPRETTGKIERNIIKNMAYFFIRLARYQGWTSIIITTSGLINLIIKSLQRSTNYKLLLFWILIIYVFLTTLGLMPVIFNWKDQVLLRLHLFRYWVPILPPLAIGCAASWESIFHLFFQENERKQKRKIKKYSATFCILFIAVSVVNIFAVKDNIKFTRINSSHYLELRNYLTETSNPNEILWIVRDLKVGYENVLPMYANSTFGVNIWEGTQKYLNTDKQFLKNDEITSGSVLIDRVHFNPNSYPIPDYLVNPPENWQLVFESSNERIAIYEVN